MSTLVSIIIPCRNGEPWLGEAIESCLVQSWRHLQIIVVDNGSSDGSRNVARSFLPHGVVVLECTRPGAGAARNDGLRASRGDLIQFLDADDLIDRDKIRIQVERLSAAPPRTLASGSWARFRQNAGAAKFVPEPVWGDFGPDDFLIRSWLGGGMMPNFAWLVPRDLVNRAGPWNEKLSLNDDGEFISRVILGSAGIVFCGESCGYYRIHDHSSLSSRRDRNGFVSAFTAIELSCRHLLDHSSSPQARTACATQYQRFAYAAYPQAPDLVALAERRAGELGGAELKPGGGAVFQLLARSFGWKFGRTCQQAWRSVRHAPATVRHRGRQASMRTLRSADLQ